MNPTPTPTLESELLSGIYTDEEKAQILGQIEEAAGANRLSVEAGAFVAKKKGILFPIVVNLLAVAVIAGGWFGADAYFQTRQEGLKLKSNKLFSTESKLLAKVLEDAKAQMAAKNAEIDKIQVQMSQLASEKADLQKSFQTRVSDQEKALRRELADTLAIEKKRLQSLGLGAAEITEKLKEFELQKNAEFNSRLDTYRRQVQSEIDQRTLAVTALQTKLQTTVGEQEKLRKDIEKQTKEREKDLQSQLSSQSADLESLKKEKEELNAFYRQADAAMSGVRSAFDNGDWAQTQTAILSLRQVLTKASASASEVVRTRAQVEAGLISTLDTAVTTLGASTSKTETNAQVEALKTQAKKERELAALQLSETQRTLAGSEAKWKQATSDAETLRLSLEEALAKLADSQTETETSAAQVANLAEKVADLQKSVSELSPYKVRFDALKALFTSDYKTAKERFLATLGSEYGLNQFPGFDPAWQDLSSQFRAEGTFESTRKQALDDVMAFTVYLQGTSTTAQATRENTEKLTRTDENYKAVVEAIQALATSGAKEAVVNTSKTQLYGTVAAVSGTKIILEPLTKVRPQVGQTVEIHRVQNRKETVLGKGLVLSATDKRVELDWTGQPSPVLTGDPAYLVLP